MSKDDIAELESVYDLNSIHSHFIPIVFLTHKSAFHTANPFLV